MSGIIGDLSLFVLAFIFGFGSDFADLLDEHGLKWFRGSAVVIGLIWAFAGVGMIALYIPMLSYVVGLVLFWLVRNKLDYLNHQMSAAILLVFAFWQAQQGALNFWLSLGCFALLFLLSIVAKRMKKIFGNLPIFQYKDILALTAISLAVASPLPNIVHIFVIAGVVVSTKWFEWFEKQNSRSVFHVIGLSIREK